LGSDKESKHVHREEQVLEFVTISAVSVCLSVMQPAR